MIFAKKFIWKLENKTADPENKKNLGLKFSFA